MTKWGAYLRLFQHHILSRIFRFHSADAINNQIDADTDLATLLDTHFNPEYYLKSNPDVDGQNTNPLAHYMNRGWLEGRNPSALFSTSWYLSNNPDVRASGQNPFVHWLLCGISEGRAGNPNDSTNTGPVPNDAYQEVARKAFDAEFYLQNYPDVVASGVDPLTHFMQFGWREQRDPSPKFKTSWYIAQNPDVWESGLNPLVHWLLFGRAEGRPGVPVDVYDIDESTIDWTAFSAETLEAIKPFFDAEFYLKQHPDVAERGIDPAVHYLIIGWRKGFDPRPDFSTSYYQECYYDIHRSAQNPFLHWCRFGRHEMRETQSYIERAKQDFRPKVSVIIPNYNHATYLRQRIISIIEQSYDNLEIIILDDKSTDNSQEVIRKLVAEFKINARLVFNEVNSGNVAKQWQKGVSLATGELIWICESDDFCEPDFLEHLVPAFACESINIAFGRIQFSDVTGNLRDGLDAYREGAEEGIWEDTLTRPAHAWFNGGFGVNNVIANVGGCIFRRFELPDKVWEQARTFNICGDWYLYIQIAGAGQITFEPRAVSYFRQHESNTSATNFHQKYYYDENMRILTELVRVWGIAPATREKFLGKVKAQYRHFGLAEKMGVFEETFGTSDLMSGEREVMHVQLHFLGFHVGGGELFPINLANAFVDAGIIVSMLATDMQNVNADMRARLNRRVPVYHVRDMVRGGRDKFLKSTGATVINSHIATSDAFLANLDTAPIELPYIVTLHGSYVGLTEAPAEIVAWILKNVTTWIYTADRNLDFFKNRDVEYGGFVKLQNAMPRDTRPAPFTREELGIAPDDTVFTLVARGIMRKGWRAAVEAFRTLREEHGKTNTVLLLIGEGEAADTAKPLAEGLEGVHFLGYQSAINGILRLSDCMILPSRFEGESYPLCLIQAIQEHVPSIATDIGEIRSILSDDKGQAAGILIENQRDSHAYFTSLATAMAKMCEPENRKRFANDLKQRAKIFDMDRLAASYVEVYDQANRQFQKQRQKTSQEN